MVAGFQDDTEFVIESTRKRIARSYTMALGLVALVIVMIALMITHFLDTHDTNSSLVNVAERQQMLSQRIAFLTLKLSTAKERERGIVLQQLEASMKQMRQEHRDLVYGNSGPGIAPAERARMNRLYFEYPLKLDEQVNRFLGLADRILRLAPHRISPDHALVRRLLTEAQSGLVKSLEAAAREYVKEDSLAISHMHMRILGLCGLAILLLIMIAAVVLKPALAYVAQAQKRLVELNQLKGDFLANMSHEIRTPMNGIFGMTELLLESSLTPKQEHYIKTLQTSGEHLLGLINDILDFSKLEAGQMKLDPIRFNLHATIEDVLDVLSSRAREKNLELLVRYVPGTPKFVVADPGRMRQILFNLIGNSIKFTDTGYVLVHVEILPRNKAKDARPWLQMRIEDTGIGIPEDKIGSLFEKFMQVESGSTRARQGTGLGLAICRNLIELMGGDIGVDSTPGRGTVFTWSIPLAGADEPENQPARQVKLGGLRALLVDDLSPNRTLYSEILTETGMECLTAENAQEALSRLRYESQTGRPVHVMITDYMMPGTDGIALTHQVKSDPALAAIPVIILSSAGERGLVKRFADAGAAACLAKPISRQQFYDTLIHVLEGRQNGIITLESSTALSARRLLARDKPLHGTHILLVEDNRVNCEITTEMLENLGCMVSAAGNGEIAIEMAKSGKFDLIFMDCQMPVMDGFEAARHIVAMKAKGEVGAMPIIALTANAMKGDRERCLSCGMDDYISKPVRKANLEAILLKWLREKLETNHQSAPLAEAEAPAREEPEAISLPLPEAEPCGIDGGAFDSARAMLGSKLSTVITYYLEDSEDYLNRIESALRRNDPASAVLPAHTLKSSSRQFGVMELSELARRAEEAARARTKGENAEELMPLLEGMRNAFDAARPYLMAAQAIQPAA